MSFFRRQPTFVTSKTRLRENAELILAAQITGEDSVSFHGGCQGCIFRQGNASGDPARFEFCSGCQYFDANWNKPNKRLGD
jgi:hypothetical protein